MASFLIFCYNKAMKNELFEKRNIKEKLFCKFQTSANTLWVLADDKVTFRGSGKGIKPLVRLIKKRIDFLKDKIIFDKIIGRAAALLLVYAGIAEVHTEVISRQAIKIFKKYKIFHQYRKSVARILNRDKSGGCPFEKMANGKTPAKFYNMIKNKF